MSAAFRPDRARALADTNADGSTLTPGPAQCLASGTLLAGRYRIQAQIGVGGMGVVYKARDEELGVDIALKVLQSDLAARPEWIDRFRRELVLAREVTHKNVVRIHDIGESHGLVFLTMRLVEGRALLETLEKQGPLPLDRALHVFRQVAEALQHAHEAGVLHRDLKPGNVLLGADDSAYITDFGLARWLHRDGVTRSGVVVGTLDYLSPEQAAGRRVDVRSDIYALGILLFEMLTGQLPFRADSKAEALAQRIVGRARDISDTGVHAPAFVRRVIRRCLEPIPARRYASVRDLITDLDRKYAPAFPRFPRPAAVGLLAVSIMALPGLADRPWNAASAPVSSASSPVPAPPMSVAVLPLVDETGDPSLAWTATGIAEMLVAQLAETSELRVLESARVLRTLRDLGREAAVRDEGELRRLAGLFEVRKVVTGSVRRAGTALRVDLRLVSFGDTGSLEARTIGKETPDDAGLFGVVAELGERLLGELGAAPDPVAPTPPPHAIPFEAAKAYREGRDRLSVGDSVGAAQAFERAVGADPAFAAALLGLSEAYQSLGRHEEAESTAERAAAVAGSAGTRLAWRARARLALLQGDPAAAERAYGELVVRYPNDTEALLDLAAAQAGQGRAPDAVATLQRVTELDKGDARAWLLLGRNMILAGDVRKAVTDTLVRALALMTQLGNEQGRGDVLNAMGVGQQRLGEYPQALASYGEAAAIRGKTGDERGVAVSLKNRASVHMAMGRFAEAEPDLSAARAIYSRIGDRKGTAEIWNEVGTLHEGRGDYAAARRAYQEGLRIRRELGDDRQLAQSFDNVGYGFFLEGEYDNAFVYWQQALDLRQKIGDRGGVVLSTQNMGFLETAQGRFPEAMKSFLNALQMGREMDFTNALAVSQGNIGLLQAYEGRYGAALTAYGEALKTLETLDDRRGLAEFTIKQAMVLTELGRLDEAESKLRAASGWLRQTGNREQLADQQVAQGEIYLAQGNPHAAREVIGRGLEQARASHSRAAILRAEIARGAARVAVGEAAAAEPEIESTLRAADALGDVVLRIRAAEALAEAQLQLSRLRPAEGSVRRALRLAERCGFEAGLYRLHGMLGRILERRGDAGGAAVAYRESARRIARLRDGMSPDQQTAFGSVAAVRDAEAWVTAHPVTAVR
jgi:tetratricopeptide (TPR) repeat protein/TolB-like protein